MGRDDDSKSEMGGMSVDGGATSIGSGGVSGSAAAGGNMLKRSASPEDAVFGVLYTLSKARNTHALCQLHPSGARLCARMLRFAARLLLMMPNPAH